MHNYTIKKSENHGIVLEKDGVETFCPFQPPVLMPMQNNTGGMSMSIIRMPCGSNCPHATVSKLNEGTFYRISCNGDKIRFEVTEKQEEIKPAKPNLIVT